LWGAEIKHATFGLVVATFVIFVLGAQLFALLRRAAAGDAQTDSKYTALLNSSRIAIELLRAAEERAAKDAGRPIATYAFTPSAKKLHSSNECASLKTHRGISYTIELKKHDADFVRFLWRAGAICSKCGSEPLEIESGRT
jgi:hypothetical protein